MDIQVNALTNAAVYILPAGIPAGGPIGAGAAGLGGLLGRAAEIQVPNPKHKMVDYKGLGLAADLEVWAGIDKLEASIKWSSFDPTVLLQIVNPFQAVSVQVMGSVDQYTSQGRSSQLPIIYLLTGVFKDGGDTMIKQHDQTEINSKMAIYHSELYVSGAQIYLFDVFSNQYMVGGVDMLSQWRLNLGQS